VRADLQPAAAAGNAKGPAGYGLYGVPFAADALGNLEIGRVAGRQISYRFRADASGTLTAVRVFFVFGSGGYMAGNGGRVAVALRNDSRGVPGATTLTAATITNPTAEDFRTVAFARPAALRAGTVYHIVLTNPTPDPVHNYVSIDDLYDETPAPTAPIVPRADLALVWKYGWGYPWAINNRHTPIFTLIYADAGRHGPGVPYVNARSETWRRPIGGGPRVAQQITPSSRIRVDGAAMRLRHTGGAEPVILRLQTSGGTILASCTDALLGTGWARCSFPAVTLSAGASYRLVAATPTGSSYAAWPLTQGSGFTSPWSFDDGHAEYSSDGGATWTSSTGDDFQFYLSIT
jgi:hypothetical protein